VGSQSPEEHYVIALLDQGSVQAVGSVREPLPGLLAQQWHDHLQALRDPTRLLQELEHLAGRQTHAVEKLPLARQGNSSGEGTLFSWVHYFSFAGRYYLSFPSLQNEMVPCDRLNWQGVARQFLKRCESRLPREEIWSAGETDYLTEVNLQLPLQASPHFWESLLPSPEANSARQIAVREGKKALMQLAEDLNSRFPRRLQRAWGRPKLTSRTYQMVVEDKETPLVILGEEGSGRHSLFQEAWFRYLSQPGQGRLRRSWLLNPNRIISGMSVIGQWQRRMEDILSYLHRPAEGSQPDILLIDRPLPLLQLGAGRSGGYSLADVLTDWLSRKQLKLVILANPIQWGVMQSQNRRFTDLFVPIQVPALSLEEALPLILHKRRALEHETQTLFSIQALEEILALYERHLSPKALPGSIGNLMDRLGEAFPATTLRSADIRQWFLHQNGIPSNYPAVDREEPLVRFLKPRLIGQEKAIEVLAKVIALIQTRLQPPGKPISSLLFVGPTGVGKTQAAKVLSQALYGDDRHLLRFDMNEYGDYQAVQRLIGGQTGGDGLLTAKVRRQPFGVLLLDEIEKAHPAVHNLLLQILDEGRLTNMRGQTTYFHNLVIVMTSNLGVRESQSPLGYQRGSEDQVSLFSKAVERFFKPELFNRIDEMVVFRPLQPEHILPIARLQINELLKRDGLMRRSTLLNLAPEALEWLARKGYDDRMGGRALKRKIEKELTVLTADQLLRVPPRAPLILDILLKEGRLHPELHPLRFHPIGNPVFWENFRRMSDKPRLLGLLRRQVDQLIRDTDEKIGATTGSGSLIGDAAGREQWALYHHKERLAQLQEELLLAQAAYGGSGKGPLIRFKEASRFEEGKVHPLRADQAAQWMDPQVLASIWEAHPLAASLLTTDSTALLMLMRKVELAERTQPAFRQASEGHRLSLRLRKRTGPPHPELVERLRQQLETLFRFLDLKFEWSSESRSFELEGFGLDELLRHEAGYHLFVQPYQNPVLLEVRVWGKGPSADEGPLEIKRIYFSNDLFLDLRRGCTGFLPLRPEEYLFLL
jgi:ATP-dependent Clp protease ATP-binding subunit ClpC